MCNDLNDLRQGLTDAPPPDYLQPQKIVQGPPVRVVAHQDKLTDMDRLNMISSKWRDRLQHAKSERTRHQTSLDDLDAQVAAVTSQLKLLQAESPSQRKCRDVSESPAQDSCFTDAMPGVAYNLEVVKVLTSRTQAENQDFPPPASPTKPERTVSKPNTPIKTLRLT